MNKLLEYMNLIPKGIANADKIIEGIANEVKMKYGGLAEDKQNEILRRRVICAGCPYMSENATTSEEYKELVGKHYETSREDDHCTFCSCPILTKTASLSSNCGIEYYNKTREVKLPLKWERYEDS